MKSFGFLRNNTFSRGFLFYNCLNLHGFREKHFTKTQIKQQDLSIRDYCFCRNLYERIKTSP